MILDLNDEETDALEKLLRGTIDGDPYPLSPRIQTLKAILAKIQPEPAHALLLNGSFGAKDRKDPCIFLALYSGKNCPSDLTRSMHE